MSTARFNTLQDASGGNSMPVADINQGRAKAWINFNGTGTIAIRDNFNISSIVDNSTGSYGVNCTTAFLNANYSIGMGGSSPGVSAAIVSGRPGSASQSAYDTSHTTAAGTAADVSQVLAAMFGD